MNLEECEKFYKSYAQHVGFSVRKSSFKKGKESVHKYRYFVRSKKGFKRAQTNLKSNRKVKLTREGCNAMFGFRKTKDGKYELFKFHEGHTHVLSTPRKRHVLNSNRGMNTIIGHCLSHLPVLILVLLSLIVSLRRKWVVFKMSDVVNKI